MSEANEVVSRAIALLYEILTHQGRAQTFEQGCFPISNGAECIRLGRPDYRSPEVQLLIRAGLVRFISTCYNPDVPEDCLRLLEQDRPRAIGLITAYVQGLETCQCAILPRADTGQPQE